MVNAKLSQTRFWGPDKNELIKTIPSSATTPQPVCVIMMDSLFCGLRLSYPVCPTPYWNELVLKFTQKLWRIVLESLLQNGKSTASLPLLTEFSIQHRSGSCIHVQFIWKQEKCLPEPPHILAGFQPGLHLRPIHSKLWKLFLRIPWVSGSTWPCQALWKPFPPGQGHRVLEGAQNKNCPSLPKSTAGQQFKMRHPSICGQSHT